MVQLEKKKGKNARFLSMQNFGKLREALKVGKILEK